MSVTHTITGGLVHLSGNTIEVILTASAPRLNHKLAVKIICDALMGSPYVEEIAPLNLVSKFDISGFIDQPVSYNFDFPAIDKAKSHEALAFSVTIDIGEVWNDQHGVRQEEWNNIAQNNQLRVLKGKLYPYELALLNEDGKNFASEYIEGGKFLTNLPNNQVVSPQQEMKLWYLSKWGANIQILLNLEIETDPPYFVDEDGEETHHSFQFTEEVLIANALIEFTINPYFMGFNVPPGTHAPVGTKIIAYSFWISNYPGGEEFESERRRFVVDNKYYDKEFIFYYVNPKSGVDCIRLVGEYSEGIKAESDTAYSPVAVGSGTKVASLKTISSSRQRTWDLNTGIKTRDEMLTLSDFLTSKERWMIDPDRLYYKRLIPAYIESGDFPLFDSLKDLQDLNIKILEAHK